MADALLSRPWVKTDLHNVLDTGSNLVHPGQSDRPRVRAIRPRNSSKRRVQCIEVDEEHNAMKINDGETAVWCFIATSTMKNVRGRLPYIEKIAVCDGRILVCVRQQIEFHV